MSFASPANERYCGSHVQEPVGVTAPRKRKEPAGVTAPRKRKESTGASRKRKAVDEPKWEHAKNAHELCGVIAWFGGAAW